MANRRLGGCGGLYDGAGTGDGRGATGAEALGTAGVSRSREDRGGSVDKQLGLAVTRWDL